MLLFVPVLLMGMLGIDTPTPAPIPVPVPVQQLKLRHCTISYADSAQVGAAEVNIISEMYVNRGDKVKAGQLLAILPDQELRAQIARLKYISELDTDIRIADLRHRQILARLQVDQALRDRHAISLQQVFMDKVDADLAAAAAVQARQNKQIAILQHAETSAHLRMKMILSPYDGIIGDIYKRPGESVGFGQPVFRVDNIDVLHVTGKLDIADINRVKLGTPIIMQIDIGGTDIPITHQRFEGTVSYIDSKIDTTTFNCPIICTIPNRDQLMLAGMEASITINIPSN